MEPFIRPDWIAASAVQPDFSTRYQANDHRSLPPSIIIRSGSGFEGGEEVPDLVLDLGRIDQRGRDLAAEQLAIATAEPMGGDPRAPSVVPRRAAITA